MKDFKEKHAFVFLTEFLRSEFMRQFLLYGHVLSTEEAELYADYELKKNPPTLENFKEQVCFTCQWACTKTYYSATPCTNL